MGRPAAVASIIFSLTALSAAGLRGAVVTPDPSSDPAPAVTGPGAERGPEVAPPAMNVGAAADVTSTSDISDAAPAPLAEDAGLAHPPTDPEAVAVPMAEGPLSGELDLQLDALTEVQFGDAPEGQTSGRGDAVVREFAVDAVVVPEPVFLITPLALAGIWACRRRR